MTSPDDELVTRVRDAIWPGHGMSREAAARAAIGVVLEEAAKAVEEPLKYRSCTCMFEARDAIRALNPKER